MYTMVPPTKKILNNLQAQHAEALQRHFMAWAGKKTLKLSQARNNWALFLATKMPC